MPKSPPVSANNHTSYGGEAVLNGVMMKGATAWSLAVRTADGNIHTEVRPLAPWMTTARRIPLVRGVVALATSVSLGSKAMQASMRVRENRTKTPLRAQIGTAVGVVLVLGVFLTVPVLVAQLIVGTGRIWTLSLVESALRLVMLVGYIAALGANNEVREVFRYHSAEHQTIWARESGQELTSENVERFPAAHPRCGTAFLLLIVIIGIVVHALIGYHSALVLALSRIAILPVIAGATYELLRLASRYSHSLLGRALAAPGLALQRITTRPTSLAHIEVAIAALTAVVEADARSANPVDVSVS